MLARPGILYRQFGLAVYAPSSDDDGQTSHLFAPQMDLMTNGWWAISVTTQTLRRGCLGEIYVACHRRRRALTDDRNEAFALMYMESLRKYLSQPNPRVVVPSDMAPYSL